MAATFTLSGDLATIVGANFSPKSVEVYIEASEPAITDTTAHVTRVGSVKATVAENGTWSAPGLIATNATDIVPAPVNGETFKYRVIIRYVDARTSTAKSLLTGWFDLTSNLNFDAIDERELTQISEDLSANILGEIQASLTSALGQVATSTGAATTAASAAASAATAAATARTGAETARAGAEAVGTTNDTVIAGRINTPGSATATALLASQAESVASSQLTGRRRLPAYSLQSAKYAAGSIARMAKVKIGDSMAQGIHEVGFDDERRQFGGIVRGVWFSGTNQSVTPNATTGTVTESTTAYDAWYTGLVTTFTAGSTRVFGVGGSTFVCDTITVLYNKEPGAGTFKLQVGAAANGSDAVDVAGFDNISADGTGLGVAVLPVSRGQHTVKWVTLTGTVRAPLNGYGFEDSTVSGVVVANISKGGLELPDALGDARARANLQTALSVINPTLVTFEAKEGASYMEQRMTQLLDIVTAAAPLADIILTATPEVGGATYSDIAAQNAALRKVAANYSRAVVFDADRAFGSYSSALAAGFYDAGEVTHYNDAGKRYLWGLYSTTFALLSRAGNSPRNVKTAVEQFTTYGPDSTDPVLTLAQDQGFDMLAKLKRAWRFLPTSGVADAASWVAQPNGSGDQQIPAGVRVGLVGPFLRSASVELLAIMSARGGGTDKSLRARSFVQTPQTIAHTAAGARAIDLSLGTLAIVTLTANVTSWSFTNPVSTGELIEVHWVQGAGGPFTLTGKAGVIDLIGGSLTLSTTAGQRDISTFRYVTGGRYVEVNRAQAVG